MHQCQIKTSCLLPFVLTDVSLLFLFDFNFDVILVEGRCQKRSKNNNSVSCVNAYAHRRPTEQCSNLVAKIFLLVCLLVKTGLLFTVLTGVIFQSLKLTDPGMETISTRAKLKEHLILDHLVTSDLQIITSTGRS